MYPRLTLQISLRSMHNQRGGTDVAFSRRFKTYLKKTKRKHKVHLKERGEQELQLLDMIDSRLCTLCCTLDFKKAPIDRSALEIQKIALDFCLLTLHNLDLILN